MAPAPTATARFGSDRRADPAAADRAGVEPGVLVFVEIRVVAIVAGVRTTQGRETYCYIGRKDANGTRHAVARGHLRLLSRESVAVVLRLVRAVDVDVDVLRLLLGELGELAAERLHVDAGHLLVELLGQPVHLVVVLVVLRPQLDLRDHLVGETVAHHERRAAGRV